MGKSPRPRLRPIAEGPQLGNSTRHRTVYFKISLRQSHTDFCTLAMLLLPKHQVWLVNISSLHHLNSCNLSPHVVQQKIETVSLSRLTSFPREGSSPCPPHFRGLYLVLDLVLSFSIAFYLPLQPCLCLTGCCNHPCTHYAARILLCVGYCKCSFPGMNIWSMLNNLVHMKVPGFESCLYFQIQLSIKESLEKK